MAPHYYLLRRCSLRHLFAAHHDDAGKERRRRVHSLLGVASREAMGRPTIVWSLDGVLPTGGGDRGVGGGVVLSKSYDPSVLFVGLNYLYGLHVNPSDSRWSLAKHNYGNVAENERGCLSRA